MKNKCVSYKNLISQDSSLIADIQTALSEYNIAHEDAYMYEQVGNTWVVHNNRNQDSFSMPVVDSEALFDPMVSVLEGSSEEELLYRVLRAVGNYRHNVLNETVHSRML